MQKSDAIVSLTSAGANELTRKFPELFIEKKTEVIPCCTNTSLFNKDITGNNRLPQLSENDHVLVYTGSIGTWYYTREMIDCMVVWKRHIPHLKLLIITKDLKELDHIISHYSSETKSMIIIASAEYREVPQYLKFAKASIFFIKPSYSKIASSPTKMAECWAMDLPIITNSGIGDNDLYFKNNLGGIQISDFKSQDYEKACQEYLSLNKTEGQYRNIALQDFDTKIAVEKYAKIYQRLVARSSDVKKKILKK